MIRISLSHYYSFFSSASYALDSNVYGFCFVSTLKQMWYVSIRFVRRTFDMDQEFVVFWKWYIHIFLFSCCWPWSYAPFQRKFNWGYNTIFIVKMVFLIHHLCQSDSCDSLSHSMISRYIDRNTFIDLQWVWRSSLYVWSPSFRCDCGFRILSLQFTGTIIL